jgi:glycosyltransferase involved in cell wall biosynthesis
LPLLSVVIPVYNEFETVREVIERVLAVDIDKEIIIVDDGSTDGTISVLDELKSEYGVKVILHPKNMGKGAALRTGFKACQGDIVIVQDADLEYFPEEYPGLVEPIIKGWADVVYGSRFLGSRHRVLLYHHYLANITLTFLSNITTNLNLTDMETCYKVFKREVIQSIPLKQDQFGFEPEITAKIARRKLKVFEVSISYNGRTYEEGKKIGIKDAFVALWCIMRYAFVD